MHGVSPAESRLQRNVEAASLLVKVKLAAGELLLVPGPETIAVSGAVVSTVHEYVVAGPVLPSAVAWTANVCARSLRLLYTRGLVHEVNAPLSRLHAKVLLDWFDEKLNVALVRFVSVGG